MGFQKPLGKVHKQVKVSSGNLGKLKLLEGDLYTGFM